jgi:hypothetical protein
LGRKLAGQGGVAHPDLVTRPGGQGGGGSLGWNLRVGEQRGRQPPKQGQTNCAKLFNNLEINPAQSGLALHLCSYNIADGAIYSSGMQNEIIEMGLAQLRRRR